MNRISVLQSKMRIAELERQLKAAEVRDTHSEGFKIGVKSVEALPTMTTSPVEVWWPQGLWPGYQEGLLEIFRMIDDDNNEVMDFSELLDLGKGVSESFTAEKCATLLGRMDDNHDGSVTRTEFLEFFGKMMEPHTRASNENGMVQIRSAAKEHIRRREALRCASRDEGGTAKMSRDIEVASQAKAATVVLTPHQHAAAESCQTAKPELERFERGPCI